MIPYSVKSFELQPLDLSDDGSYKVAFNKTNFLDYDKDVIVPEAYRKTISERGPQGKQLIYHLTDHSWKWKDSFISKPKELFIDNTTGYLVAAGTIDIKTNPHGAFMHARYVRGEVTQHSVGIQVTKTNPSVKDYREITELRLLEGSAVLWGANIDTPTLDAKSLEKESADNILKEIQELESQFKKYLKTGMDTDAVYFMGMQLNGLYHKLKTTIENTKPLVSTLPSEDVVKAIKSNFKF